MRKSPMGKKWALAGVLAVLVLGAGIFLLWRCARPQSPVPDLDTLLEMEEEECLAALESHGFVCPPCFECFEEDGRERAAAFTKEVLEYARHEGWGPTGYGYTELVDFSVELCRFLGIPTDYDWLLPLEDVDFSQVPPLPDLDTLLEMEDDELLYALETHSLVLPPSCAGNREEAARLIKILLIRAQEKGVGDTHYKSTEWIVFSTHLYWTVGIPLDIDQPDSPP